MLCEICQEREATIHTRTGSESTFSRLFCQQCFQEKGPIAGVQIVKGLDETCHYCGQPCDFGSGRISIQISGAVVCCRQCGADFEDYLQHHMKEPSSEDGFFRDLEAFMKKQVAARPSEQ